MPLVRFANLEPEQKAVLNVAMTTRHPIILVQGVAGSGKTTIALNTLVELFSPANPLRPAKHTAILLTYGPHLKRWCYDQLLGELASEGHDDRLSQLGQVVPYRINILTYHEFLASLLPPECFAHYLPDSECIEIIRSLMLKRPTADLLPSQVFSVITAFLKGRPEFHRLSPQEISSRLATPPPAADMRHPMHNAYWSVIPAITMHLYGPYRSALGATQDRADVSSEFLRRVRESRRLVDGVQHLCVRDIQLFNSRNLSLERKVAQDVIEWLHAFLYSLSEDTYEPDCAALSDVLDEPTEEGLALLKQRVPILAGRHGIRGTWLCDAARDVMPDPFVLVDEAQDLSAIECRALIELWFQLPRDPSSDRLMLFGDINQQLTPTGFTWEDITNTIYQQSGDKSRFTEDDSGLVPSPYRALVNNYRTTENIAGFVHAFMALVGLPNLPQNIRHEYRRNLIDPSRTCCEAGERPMLVVGSKALFLGALGEHIRELEESRREAASAGEVLLKTFMVISERGADLAALGARPERPAGAVAGGQATEGAPTLSFLGILDCKGLEFESCVVWGLPVLGLHRQPTPDLIGQWYTALTRAKKRLLLYLNESEYGYLCRWSADEVAFREVGDFRQAGGVEALLGLLRLVGTTVLGREELRRLAERYLDEFCRSLRLEELEQALVHFWLGKWSDEARSAAIKGGQALEAAGRLGDAADVYVRADEILRAVACLTKMGDRNKAGALTEALALRGGERRFEEAQCWEALERWPEGVRCYLEIPDAANAERAARNVHDVVARDNCWRQIAEVYRARGPGHWPDACRCARQCNDRGFVTAVELDCRARSDYELAVRCWIEFGDTEQAATIAQDRQHQGDFGNAALVWLILGEAVRAADCWVRAGNQAQAEAVLTRLETEPGKEFGAIAAWYQLCNRRDRAEALIERVWATGRPEHQRRTIDLCLSIDARTLADRLRRQLDPLNDFELAVDLARVRFRPPQRAQELSRIAAAAEARVRDLENPEERRTAFRKLARFYKREGLRPDQVRCLHAAYDDDEVERAIAADWESPSRKAVAIVCLAEIGKLEEAREKVSELENAGGEGMRAAFECWKALGALDRDAEQRASVIAERTEHTDPEQAAGMWTQLGREPEAVRSLFRANRPEHAQRLIAKLLQQKHLAVVARVLVADGQTERARDLADQVEKLARLQGDPELLEDALACWKAVGDELRIRQTDRALDALQPPGRPPLGSIRAFLSDHVGLQQAREHHTLGWLSVDPDSDAPLTQAVAEELEFLGNLLAKGSLSEGQIREVLAAWRIAKSRASPAPGKTDGA